MKKPEGYPRISVIICTLNEAESLPDVLPKVPAWVDEVVLVDGHSRDDTVAVARRLRPDVRVVYQTGKGKGDALRIGFQTAGGDIVVTMDADGATNPDELSKFIEPLLEGCDFVKGSRFRRAFPRDKPWHRILGNWLITLTFDLLFLKRYTDLCSGYNAFWRQRVDVAVLLSADGYENEPLINARIARRGCRVIEVGHTDPGRASGDVKELSWRQGPKAIKSILKVWLNG
jgi:glycosyltransferase involved in cell wall biosynthesis